MNTRKVTINRQELANWYDTFQQCSGAAKGDTEDPKKYRDFKYWCGRNCDRIKSVIKRVQEWINTERAAPAYIEFCQARRGIAEQYSERDAKGLPIELDDGDVKTYRFTEEGRAAGDAALKALREEFAVAIAGEQERQKRIMSFMAQDDIVELFTLPWDYAPERVSGSYLVMLAAMFEGGDEPAGIRDEVAPQPEKTEQPK